ncbi:MAG: alpha/beta fold hydrolase [Bryobacteraceae bacterium]
MPYAENQGARIYWESHGEGKPVVLIMGLAFSLEMWHRTLPYLTPKYRAIVFDNRGVGRSGVPPGPYRISLMASDVLAVMDDAGVDAAHIVGASMGGMIAQELAIGSPARVRSLVLACSFCGVIRMKWPSFRLFRAARRWRHMTPRQRAEYFVPFLYSPSTPRERIDEDLRIRVQHYPTDRGYFNQAAAMMLFSSHGRLRRIQCPTLIVHGERDVIVPIENASILARRIPNARLVSIPNASHLFTTDQPDLSHETLLSFLASTS